MNMIYFDKIDTSQGTCHYWYFLEESLLSFSVYLQCLS